VSQPGVLIWGLSTARRSEVVDTDQVCLIDVLQIAMVRDANEPRVRVTNTSSEPLSLFLSNGLLPAFVVDRVVGHNGVQFSVRLDLAFEDLKRRMPCLFV
jgi:hypothetical protein